MSARGLPEPNSEPTTCFSISVRSSRLIVGRHLHRRVDVGDDDAAALGGERQRLRPSTSPEPTPMVMMTLLAMRAPRDLADAAAAPRRATPHVCVAPNSIAFSRLNSTGSMAMICLAPASLAPWMALAPMPPTPTTATVSPGVDLGGVDRRAPAGDDAAAEQAGAVERDVLVDLDAAGLVDHGVVGERAEQAHQAEVLALRVVAGGAVGDLRAEAHQRAEVAQVLVAGRAADGQRPHDGMKPNTTWSPGASQLTPSPTSCDDAGALVAADDRQLERQVAGDEVLVGVAHARRRRS